MLLHLRESPRIPGFDYRGPLTGHLVMVTRRRRRLFSDPRIAEAALTCLTEAAAKFEAELHAYCLMPDHAHVLAGVSEGHSLAAFAKHFKQLSGSASRRRPARRPGKSATTTICCGGRRPSSTWPSTSGRIPSVQALSTTASITLCPALGSSWASSKVITSSSS